MKLLTALVGSRLHGLHNEYSDYDYKHIEVSPLVKIISPFRKVTGKETISETEDNCVYELQHFAKLMAGCNPTILEVLWSNVFVDNHWLAAELIENKTKLLHREKIYYSHRGYANDQRKLFENSESEARISKALCAYSRIMLQGISLLKSGDFNPVIISPLWRSWLLDIKYHYNPHKRSDYINSIELLETQLEEAYNNCTINFDPDVEWLEDYLVRTYVVIENETHSITAQGQQISRCSD